MGFAQSRRPRTGAYRAFPEAWQLEHIAATRLVALRGRRAVACLTCNTAWPGTCSYKALARKGARMKQHVERLAEIESEARRMARSGAYPGFRAIAHRLLEAGYEETPKLFKNRWTQEEISRLCYASRFSPATQP